MKNSQSQLNYKKIRNYSSQLSINRKNKFEDLIILINNLNTNIKFFCQSLRQCVNEGKQNLNNKEISSEIFELIEENLNDFIYKAKDIFKKMKYTQKISLIQQEINDAQNNSKLEEMINNKMKVNSEDKYLNSKINNFNNLIDENNFINTNNNLIDENYKSGLYNSNTNNYSKKNNYIENKVSSNSLNKKINNKNYKKIKNHISDNKMIFKNINYGTNYNLRKNSKNNDSLNVSKQNNIFKNYNKQYNNFKNNKNSKSVNDLRKKKLVNNNSLNDMINPSQYFSSSNATQSNIFSYKKEILDNLNEIISILKELKLLNENILNKSWEAEKHKKLLNKIYQEVNKLIKNIFKENYFNLNTSTQKDGNLHGNIRDTVLKEDSEQLKINNTDYNLTYNYNTNNNEDNLLNENEKYQQIKKVKIYYDNKIKSRDLIIKKLKNELNMKDKNIHNQNIKYNLLLKSKINNNSFKERSYNNEDILGINKISKMNFEELIEKRKKIIELEQKLKTLKSNSDLKMLNSQKQIEKYNELKKAYDILKMNNEKLKKQNNFFQKKLNNNKNNYVNILNLQNESFSIIALVEKDKISEEAKKIIDEIKNELQIKNENFEKINEELNIYKAKEIKLKEEISELNQKKNEYESEEKKLKEEILKSKNELSKSKENILKIQKDYEILKEKNNNNLNENKFLQETIEKQKKLLNYQDKEIITLKLSKKEEANKLANSINNITSENDYEDDSFNNNINKEEKKNKKKSNLKQRDQLQMEQDKIVLKYELLKNDYDKLNSTLQQKQKLLDNFSKLTTCETSSKTNIDEQILELISEHKKEIDDLTEKYNRNIINLKMILPINYSPETHCILIDKKYNKYNLRWFLLTITTATEKNYENTFWVPEDEIKTMLDQFNKFKTEKELEEEQFESIYITQQKWIKQIDQNEQLINKLKAQLQKYEATSSTG